MRIFGRIVGTLVAGLLVSGALGSAHALDQKPVLSVEAAEKMALACDAYARSHSWKMNIAVLDDGGGLLYFRRDPAAFRGSVDISINKAWTATQFGFPGGLPVKAGDLLIGGIGVSGATGDQDEECAKVGLEAAKDLLK